MTLKETVTLVGFPYWCEHRKRVLVEPPIVLPKGTPVARLAGIAQNVESKRATLRQSWYGLLAAHALERYVPMWGRSPADWREDLLKLATHPEWLEGFRAV
jgi:hypothetical protein